MIFYICAILLLLIIPSKVYTSKYNDDYISKDTCNVIKGVFILLIFASHFFKAYVRGDLSVYDQAYLDIRIFLGQCVVSMFLFYSGYGIVESIKRKGFNYTTKLPQKRILKTLLIYDLSVIIFLLKDVILKILGYRVEFDLQRIVKSFVALESAGNDNWYIFVIVCLYIFSWLSFRAFRNDGRERYSAVILITVLTLILAYSLKHLGYGRYWYNSMLCFPVGCWYALFKESVNTLLKRNYFYFPAVVSVVLVYLFVHKHWEQRTVFYCLTTVIFAVMVLLITMKFSPRNAFLKYCGIHLNSLFLMHRLPMSVLNLTPIRNNHYIHFALSVLLTFIIAFLFEKLTNLLGGAAATCYKKLKGTDFFSKNLSSEILNKNTNGQS